ncbi:site-specific integrase [Bradyrhizobium sp. CB1015]|uniref:tyrosine-type recombinase/integrase n=1 Tax=Bradyrhizobium sp. CB1015 TaxID=2976822 RepID=UPI0021A9D7E6|nr:site-specific integrase [Bradyrhizobium sp. CB1015]UWU94400.1 integrase arm-type DNA-binding domain-containing protein [Bradyrhizobium sp. CB1015]
MALTIKRVERLSKAGRYGDGHGLYLQINSNGAKSWLFRYQRGSKETAMGLGAAHTVTLEEAREAARQNRLLLKKGIDPLVASRAERSANAAAQAGQKTFDQVLTEYFKDQKAAWKSDRDRKYFLKTMERYVTPTIGKLMVSDIRNTHIEAVLKQDVPEFRSYPAGQFWKARAKTARALRYQLEAVFAWAKAKRKEYGIGDNPAKWDDLKSLFPKEKKKEVQHHPAMSYAEVPAFLAELRETFTVQRAALEFTILTAARTGETLGARWSEIDLSGRIWTIPPERMKTGVQHDVPLSDAAVAILKQQQRLSLRGNPHVFPGNGREGRLSARALAEVLSQSRPDCTVHGFRSSFRDWAAERTNFPRDLLEMSLAHTVGRRGHARLRGHRHIPNPVIGNRSRRKTCRFRCADRREHGSPHTKVGKACPSDGVRSRPFRRRRRSLECARSMCSKTSTPPSERHRSRWYAMPTICCFSSIRKRRRKMVSTTSDHNWATKG